MEGGVDRSIARYDHRVPPFVDVLNADERFFVPLFVRSELGRGRGT